MGTVLWGIQILLAVVFLATGLNKAVRTKAKLAESMRWARDLPAPLIRLIGVAEILGSAGLILPELMHLAPLLTPIAATCLALTMAGALVTHVRLRETGFVVLTAVLIGLCGLIAWGRCGPYPL